MHAGLTTDNVIFKPYWYRVVYSIIHFKVKIPRSYYRLFEFTSSLLARILHTPHLPEGGLRPGTISSFKVRSRELDRIDWLAYPNVCSVVKVLVHYHIQLKSTPNKNFAKPPSKINIFQLLVLLKIISKSWHQILVIRLWFLLWMIIWKLTMKIMQFDEIWIQVKLHLKVPSVKIHNLNWVYSL